MDLVILIAVVGSLLAAIWFGIGRLKKKLVAAGQEMARLVREGIATTGRVSATDKRRMSRGQYEYYVSYTFTTKDRQEVSKELRVQSSRFDEYVEGKPIDIVYLPADPTVSATCEMVDIVRNRLPA